MRSHKSLGGSSAIGSPTTPINGVSLVNTACADCTEGGTDVDVPTLIAVVAAEPVVSDVALTVGAADVMTDVAAVVETAGAVVTEVVDVVVEGDATATAGGDVA